MEVKIYDSLDECHDLREDWNEMAAKNSCGPFGIGVTCTFEFFETIAQTHLNETKQHILVARDSGRVMGILPCYSIKNRNLGMRQWDLKQISEIYPGRTGFLLREQSMKCLAALLDTLYKELKIWDTFSITMVKESVSEKLLLDTLRDRRYRIEQVGVTHVPYIELSSTWDDYLLTRKSHFRSGLKRRRKKLASQGVLEIKKYATEEEVPEFLDAMLKIERQSWKESSGTSLTRNPKQEEFHRQFAVVCARAGWLRCYLLCFDGLPIAYHYNVLYSGVLYDFKSSYIESYKRNAPGKILRSMFLEQIIDEGVKFMDYLGDLQPHKMDWTDKTYQLTNYRLFNDSLRGKLQRVKYKIAHSTHKNVK